MDLGVFMPTGSRGYIISTAAPANEPSWALNRRVAEMAERYGFGFLLAMVKFRGFGGPSGFWDAALEPFTLVSALAAITRRVTLIGTASSLAMPPAVVARMAATMDQVAPGRVGINVITGWARHEYEQMGLWPGEAHYARRYDMLAEYVRVMRDLWTTGRCDLEGEFHQMRDCVLEPRPANPVPIVVAGSSDQGLDFAARHADYNFVSAPDAVNDPESCAVPVRRLREAAARHGRDVKALLWVTVITDATDAGAAAKWADYMRGIDMQAIGNRVAQAAADARNTDRTSTAFRHRGAEVAPVGGCKLVGSYATIAARMDRLAAIPDLAGVMLAFDDYDAGMQAFGERVMPLMRSRPGG
ncbi:MAG: LLM class flavin-dependent oxidoreductase [Acetobacteraceae bacterium]|nr:LLM class flavin-dependent oxidoreductase [Acetobacteraceae bacterium]